MAEVYDVIGFDPYIQGQPSETVQIVGTTKEAVEGRDLIFIAVPTPHDPKYGGSTPIADLPPKDFDYDTVKDVLRTINQFVNKGQLVVLISTVLPGTVRRELEPLITNARFIYNPYLIAMGSVKWDMVNPECLIIGTEDGTLTGDAKILIDFYRPLMKNDPRINVGTWDEAEAIKIFYNTFISTKIGLVNMIQDVAEANGNINVDVVTDALKAATMRIAGPKFMTAGMGDGGACHPRDNIALRYMAQKYSLGYDLFHAVMWSRDKQAERMANRLLELNEGKGWPIVIHGRAFKPYVPYTIGSYSELVAWYIEEAGTKVYYADPETDDEIHPETPCIFLMAHNPAVTYLNTGVELRAEGFYCEIPKGSIIVDPWRTIPDMEDIEVIHYGNPRKGGGSHYRIEK
jgi:UDPglucose 6-dehydrogenase